MGRERAPTRRWVFFHTTHPLDPTGIHSGAETALLKAAQALVRRGHEVTVVGCMAGDREVGGVRYLCAGAAGGYDVDAGLARVGDACDVLVSTMRGDVLERSLRYAAIRRRVLWPNTAVLEALRLPAARLAEVADRVVMVSRDQADRFAAAGVPRARLDLLPNGVDADVFHPGAPTDRLPGRVIFVGALVPDKGLDLVLRAMPAVRALVPAAELVVCGSAALWGRAEYLDATAIAAELPYVHFRGALPQEAIAGELRRAAVCVVPSPPERYVEAFPLVAVEAQACGTPVIVTRNGGLPEAVEEGVTGWVVDPCAPETLGAALVRALRDPEGLAAMGERAAARTRERHGWERHAATLEALVDGGDAPADRRPARRRRSEAEARRRAEPAPATAPEIGLVTTWRQRCGLARHAEQLAAALPAGSVRVLAEESAAAVPNDAPTLPVETAWRRGEPLDGVVAAARAHGLRLVHVNHHGALFGSHLSRCLAELAAHDVRTVVTMHAPNQIDPEIAAIGRVADRILVPTEGARLEVIAGGVAPGVVRVVPHGIPPLATADASALRAEMGLAAAERLVVSVGFVQPHKGLHEVVQAVAALRGRLPLQYLILGGCLPGDAAGAVYRDACLAEAARLDVAERVTLVEAYLPDATLAAYLRAADVIVLPYRTNWWESSAAARLALASGRPVITSAALAFFDLGGAVFRTTGAYDLARAIECVLTNPELAATLVAAAAGLAERHSWARVAALHRDVYRELLAWPRTRPCPAPTRGRPRVLLMLRPDASRTGGGDYVAASTLVGAEGRVEVVCREGGSVSADAALVHLVNFSTYEVTRAHAERAAALGLPYVVTAFYEDWPSFKVAAEACVQSARRRLGLPPTVDLDAYARMHAGEQRDLLTAMRTVANGARLVVATGPSEEARLQRDFPGIRTRSIPLAVPEHGDGDRDAFIATYGTRDFVLCVGRVEPRKNQLTLLEALADDPVDVVLATGGYAYRTDYLEACQALRRRGRTLYLPALTPRELVGAYQAARVHVLPSWFELPGFVTLEALGAGGAAVASDRGTIRDYLGDTIPYAAPDDPAALRRAIEAACGWSFAAARRRVASFTLARHRAAWMELYDEVVRESRATCPAPADGAWAAPATGTTGKEVRYG